MVIFEGGSGNDSKGSSSTVTVTVVTIVNDSYNNIYISNDKVSDSESDGGISDDDSGNS